MLNPNQFKARRAAVKDLHSSARAAIAETGFNYGHGGFAGVNSGNGAFASNPQADLNRATSKASAAGLSTRKIKRVVKSANKGNLQQKATRAGAAVNKSRYGL